MNDAAPVPSSTEGARPQSASDLLPLVYEELRKLAAHKLSNEAPGQTLQPTALVHEAWLRLSRSADQNWQNRTHFFRTAAECMRRILIDNARRKQQVCHGGGQQRIPFEGLELPDNFDHTRLLEINEALDKLAALENTKAEVVKLRFFGGLENREIAEVLGISERTVERAWRFAKAWLLAELGGEC
jgi:RNA polymerase sigma factor (TIGR02999 family)